MNHLTTAATKSEEIAFFEAFLDHLSPGTYLHSMFADSLGMVKQNIVNDIAFPPLPELYRRQQELDRDIKDKEEKLATKQAAIREAQRQYSQLEEGMLSLKRQVEKLAKLV